MGSKHRKEADSSGDDSDASREHKRHKKEHKKEKHKKEKHKKHKKEKGKDKDRDREQERLVKEAKKFLKQKLKSGDPQAAAAAAAAVRAAQPVGPAYEGPVDPISADNDYFTKNPEFSWWLRECRGKFFSEQSTEDNRSMFVEFVEDWNSRRCPAALYTGDLRKEAAALVAAAALEPAMHGA